MKRLLLPALLLTTLTACTATPAGTLPAAAPTPTPASTPAPTAAPAPADALTPEEKIGQLFIIRPDALDLTLPQETINDAKADGVTTLTDAMRETLQAYPVGGICQFGKNITDPEQLAQFNADLQAASRTPLFIAVDEEGGAVARLANHPAFDLPQYESAAAVGASGDPADACAMGQTIGAYLKEYGFNMDFAPDADVNTNPDNPIIGTRAFSSNAATAAEMAAAAADGLRTGGILPTLKHFPGHGDTAEDSHTALAVTYKTLDELQVCELLGTWSENAACFAAGETVVGIVRSVEEYGVFIEIAPNLAGLAEADSTLRPGQAVSVYIKNILPDKMKIKLVVVNKNLGQPLRFEPHYFVTRGRLKRWTYSTPQSRKQIETVF